MNRNLFIVLFCVFNLAVFSFFGLSLRESAAPIQRDRGEIANLIIENLEDNGKIPKEGGFVQRRNTPNVPGAFRAVYSFSSSDDEPSENRQDEEKEEGEREDDEPEPL